MGEEVTERLLLPPAQPHELAEAVPMPPVSEHPSPERPGGEREGESKTSTTSDDSLAFMKNLAELSAIFVGFTFVGGWSYFASYYGAFGLNAFELDLPLPVVCTTGVYVFFGTKWHLPVVALLLGCLFAGKYLRGFRSITTAAVVVWLFFTVYKESGPYAVGRAAQDMLIDSSSLPYIAISSRVPKTDQPSCVDYQTYGSCDCKLLVHSKGTYYFFTPVPKPDQDSVIRGSLNVFTLTDSDVTGTRILRGLQK